MNVEEQEWVQQTLLNYERDRCISKFISVQDEDAVGKGINYSSDIKRLNMKVVLNSGEMEERSVVFKMMPTSEYRRKAIKQGTTYAVEARMFTEVLPKMEKYRRSKEKCGEPLFPICYGIRNGYEDFLLEDLKVAGFELANRYEGMDHDHVVLAIKTLAKYHALGAVLIERGDIFVRDFDTNVMKVERQRVEIVFKNGFETLAEDIEESWDPEWRPYAKKIKKFSKNVMDLMINALEKDATKFKTISHGDYWLSNVMFRNDDNGKPNSIRMIDFQLCNYVTPIKDVQYLLNTSPAEDVLDKKRELFLFYCDQLLKYLERYEYMGTKPSQEELDKAFEVMKPYGLTVGLIFRPFQMMPTEEAADMEKFSKNWTEKKATKSSVNSKVGEACIRILKKNLKEGKEFGLL